MITVLVFYLGTVSAQRSHSFPFVTGDGFRAIADYVCEADDCFGGNVRPFFRTFSSLGRPAIFFVKTDFIGSFPVDLDFPHVLITHNSDYGITAGGLSYLANENLLAWYVQNPLIRHPKLVAIPLGIMNQNLPFGLEYTLLEEKRTSNVAPSELLMINFSIHTNPPIRGHAVEVLRAKGFDYMVPKDKNYSTHLDDTLRFKFNACPPGNGWDTYRLWETMYLGRYPVVLQRDSFDDLLSGLPVLQVRSFADVDKDMLERFYRDAPSMGFSDEKLSMSYWASRILYHAKRGHLPALGPQPRTASAGPASCPSQDLDEGESVVAAEAPVSSAELFDCLVANDAAHSCSRSLASP